MSELTDEQRRALIESSRLLETTSLEHMPSVVWHEGIEYHLQDGRYVPVQTLPDL